MKKRILLIILAVIATAMPVYADHIDDQIEKIEKEISILQAQLEKLKKKKNNDKTNADINTSVGEIYAITPVNAYCVNSVRGYQEDVYPQSGNTFLIVDLEIENISSEDDYFNYFSIDSYVDGYSTELDIGLVDHLAAGDVRSGKKITGSVGFEVPIDWKELEINYNEEYANPKSAIKLTITPDSPVFQ